uniref:SKP1-like protein n=1 Tax=Oryza nivara TaxID=4536 RepID=A0A0E0G4Y5_ORYNI
MAAMVVMMCGELMPHAISSSASVLLLGEIDQVLTKRATEMAASAAAADGAADGGKMILLISSDGAKFELSEAAASLSKTLGNMIEDDCATNGAIPLANVAADILAMVVEYCNKHAAAANASGQEELIRKFDAEFVSIDRKKLFGLINAANFLNMPCLLELTCQRAADLIKDMMPEQVREVFGIENDFTPEEEAEVRNENAWAYEISPRATNRSASEFVPSVRVQAQQQSTGPACSTRNKPTSMAAANEGADAGDSKILLISSDGQHFQVTESEASMSKLVSNMIEDECTENGVPLPNVASNVLAKVLEYCKKHAAAATAEDIAVKDQELKSFDASFIDVDNTMLFGLILAANYFNVPSLLDLACQHMADLIKGKTVQEIRDTFGIIKTDSVSEFVNLWLHPYIQTAKTNNFQTIQLQRNANRFVINKLGRTHLIDQKFTPLFSKRATEMASAAAADVAADGKKMILLVSSDGVKFELSEAAASLSKTLGNMIEDDCATNGAIPLANVAADILAKVVEYCNKHAAAAAAKASGEEELRRFDAEFVNIDRKKLFGLINAANFLNMPCLLELTCQRAADLIKDMMPEQVREVFGIENDFTPEEEAEVRNENAWAYEMSSAHRNQSIS